MKDNNIRPWLTVINAACFALMAIGSQISAFGQQYFQPDGTITNTQNRSSESNSGDYPVPESAVPDPMYPPGIAPESGLTTDPTQLKTAEPELLNMPSGVNSSGYNPALQSGNSILPSASADQSATAGLFDKQVVESSAILHEGQLISDVKVVGNKQNAFEKILPILKTRPGRPFSKQLLEDDVRRLIYSRMFTDVQTYFKETRTANEVSVEVVFKVSERNVIQYIRYVGNEKIKKKTLEKESYLKIGSAVDPSEVASSRERLESFYKAKGFARASVSVVQGLQASDPGVIFQINEGPKQKVHWTSFEGNTIVSDARLRTQIQSKHGFLWIFSGELDYDKMDADIKTLEEYYKNLGFLDVRVGREVKFNSKEDWADVIFYVNEGPRYHIRNVTVAGATKYSPEELTELMEVKEGDYFNKPKLSMGVRRIQSKYGKIGHVFADVKPDIRYLETPGECDLVLAVKEGDVYRVGKVNVLIAGDYPHTQIDTVLNRMTVKPGDIMDTTKIKASERRLKASQLFANDPQRGVSPSIVYSPPEIRDLEKQEGEQMAAPVQRPENSQSFRGQDTAEYKHVVQFAPSQPIAPGEKTLDVTFYGVWQPSYNAQPEAPVWRNNDVKQVYESNDSTSTQTNTPVRVQNSMQTNTSSYTPVYVPVNTPVNTSVYTSVNTPTVSQPTYTQPQPTYTQPQPKYTQPQPTYTPTTDSSYDPYIRPIPVSGGNTIPSGNSASGGNTGSRVEFRGQSYAPFAQYNKTSDRRYAEQEARKREVETRFLGQNTAQTQYSIDPFGTPAIPSTQSQTQQSLYPANASGNSSMTNYSAAGSAKSSVPSAGWSGSNSNALSLSSAPASPSVAPYSGSIGQSGNIVQDNYQLQPGIPSPNSPTGQAPTNFPATQSFNQNFMGITPEQADRNSLPLATSLEETMTGKMMFSLGVSSEAGLLGSVVIDEQNFDWRRWPRNWRDFPNGTAFRGRGQHFRIEASPGTSVQRYSVSFEEPYLLNTNLSWGVSGVYYERFYTEWSENRIGGQTSLGYHFHQDLVGYINLRAYSIKLFDPISPTPQDLSDALGTSGLYGISAKLVYDKRDSPYMPTEGWYMSGEIEQVVGTYHYPRASFGVKKFITLHERPDGSGKHVLSLKTSVDWTDADTPIYEHYFTGGFSTIRGFKYREATVRENGVIVGGHTQVLACAEYLFPITADDMLKGVIFCDSGTSDRNFGDWSDRYRVSIGMGLRITIPWMGSVPIALDFAVPLSDNPYDEKEVFGFSMGGNF